MAKGKFGEYGGQFAPEVLMPALEELEREYTRLSSDREFREELDYYLREYAGRPTQLTFCRNLSAELGIRLYLKREDSALTGAHKINNALGQALLAKRMGKKRVSAETGAGQHGVATATAAAITGLQCEIFMGSVDIERQKMNVFRMQLLGAKVTPVNAGSKTLKDAISEAMRDWSANVETTHYLLGSALGPHPYPAMVRDFQSVIGTEARRQILEKEGRLPDLLVACVGGGSNAIGLFHPFLDDKDVGMVGVEAGGRGMGTGEHAARFSSPDGKKGVLQGTYTYLLQNEDGQVLSTHSVSAGLDYAAVGPEHSLLRDLKRARYTYATDSEALAAFKRLSESEGLIPALESAHALAYVFKNAGELQGKLLIANLSGRGDKDVEQVSRMGLL